MSLGKWAVLDIETTGISPGEDQVIDLGYLQFDGINLIKKYTSLVRPNFEVSAYISKLTGITNEQLKKAPVYSEVEIELFDLESHFIIAHNAKFEESFLKSSFDKLKNTEERESYHDSIFYLALLNPQLSVLNLEFILNYYGIADKEEHRGLSDSLDLLRVLLTATYICHQDRDQFFKLSEIFQAFTSDFWFKNFFFLSDDELISISQQIGFDLLLFAKAFQTGDAKLNASESFLPEGINFEKKFSGENLKSIFQSEKEIQTLVPGYTFRESQQSLALKVGQSLKNNIHSLIQAPTGTGKTFGYLVPSILFSIEQREQILVSTGSKTLQEQAFLKDVPKVLKLLSLEDKFKVVRLVGSNNHLCELIYRENKEQVSLVNSFNEQFTEAFFESLFFYNSKMPYERQLTRDQIPFVLKKNFPEISEKENLIAVDYRACVGQNCPFVKKCSYIQGLREAKEAGLIIGNHSLMFNWPRSISRPQYIIVDEAHKIESEATSSFSIEVEQNQLEIFLKSFPQGLGALIYLISQNDHALNEEKITKLREETHSNLMILKDHIDSLPILIESLFKKLPNYSTIYNNEISLPDKSGLKDSLSSAIQNHFESIHFVLSLMYTKFQPELENVRQFKESDNVNYLKAFALFESHYAQLEKLSLAFTHFLSVKDDWANVLHFSENSGFKILSSPINVGKLIFENLLEPSSSVVLTSATLANAQGDSGGQSIEWMSGYYYLKPDKRFKKPFFLPPVFDYKKQSKIFLSSDFKSLTDSYFVKELIEKIYPLILDLNGRTLLLFSSRLRFEQAVDILLRKIDHEIPVFVQGLGKNVVEEFKKSSKGVLVGMESFGEGIDIPGEKLQFIVIDKIPDLRQEIVIQKRRDFFESNFGNEFNDYFMANRTRSLHQKFGRLIRTSSDFGAILVLDSRVKKWKKSTIDNFKKLMEPYDLEFSSLDDSILKIKEYFKI